MAKKRAATKRQKAPTRRGMVERRTVSPKAPRAALHAVELPRVRGELVRRSDGAKLLNKSDLRAALRRHDMTPKDGSLGELHVELSPAVPYVAGRGWLDAAGTLQTWFAQGTMSFYPDQPDKEQGVLYIWLDGLTPGHAYVAQIRVGGWTAGLATPGTYNIGASDAAHVDVHDQGASQTIPVFIPSASYALSLIRIDTKGMGGWLFDDVTVLHLGDVS